MTATSDQSGGESLPRDRHLFGPGPKRILSLDGGGVRGAISVAFLERIEKIIQEEHVRHAGNGNLAPPRAAGGSATTSIWSAARRPAR